MNRDREDYKQGYEIGKRHARQKMKKEPWLNLYKNRSESFIKGYEDGFNHIEIIEASFSK